MSLCSNKCSFFNSDGGYFFPLPIYFIFLLLHSNHTAIYHSKNNTKVLVAPSTFFKKSINKRNTLNILVLLFDNRSLSHKDIFLLSLWNLFSWGILLFFFLVLCVLKSPQFLHLASAFVDLFCHRNSLKGKVSWGRNEGQ